MISKWRGRIEIHLESPLFRNAYLLMLNTISTAMLGVFYWILAARLYTPLVVGDSSLAITTMLFISTLGGQNLYVGFMRFIPRMGKEIYRLVITSYVVALVLTLIAVLILLVLNGKGPFHFPFFEISPAFTIWYIISCMLWIIFVLQDAAMIGLREAKWVPLENGLFGVLKMVLLIVLVTTMPTDGIFISWSLPVIGAIVLVNLLLFIRLIPQHVARQPADQPPVRWRDMFRYSVTDFVGTFFWSLLVTALPYIANQLAGEQMTAYFSVAWTVAAAYQYITNGMSLSFTVEGAYDSSELGHMARRAFKQLLRLLIPTLILGIVVAPIALRIYGDDYAAESTVTFQLLALGAIPFSISTLFVSIARVQQKLRQMILVQIILCVLTLGLAFILTPQIGISGIGLAYLVGETIVAAGLLLTVMRPILMPRFTAALQRRGSSV